jgi:hypothetical protein
LELVGLAKDLDEIRRELARLARRKECRIEVWTPERPTEWMPDRVINPESGLPFTKAGAWALVATLLETGHPMTEVEMRHPPGETGYALEVALAVGSPVLYIKLQLIRGKIIGRSFHNSLRS